ncbi:hypothetical protein RQP46_010474 [Phenoliferia psychrophenolica]
MSGSSAASGASSGNTPDQTGIPAPPLPSATLLSLPNELLASIGHHLAPLGGYKAGVLRLVCRRLGGILAPLAWSSITFPPQMDDLDPLLVSLLKNQDGQKFFVTSVRYQVSYTDFAFPVFVLESLPNLNRLHLAGTPNEIDPTNQDREIPSFLRNAFVDMPNLRTLVLDDLDLTHDDDLAIWAPSVKSLVIKSCTNGNRPFERGPTNLSTTLLHKLNYWVPENDDAAAQANFVTEALLTVRATASTIMLQWVAAEDLATNLMNLPWPSGPEAKPVHLHINGLAKLFSPPFPAANLVTTTFVVRLLNWIGAGHLASLTLPLNHTFQVNDIFSNLALPHLRTLSLVNAYPPLIPFLRDVLDSSSCANLFSLIKYITAPSLKTLHLRGWLDYSSVLALGGIAQSAPHQLAVRSLPLVGLLHYLRGTTTVELKLENSEGHADGDVQCIFTREADGDFMATIQSLPREVLFDILEHLEGTFVDLDQQPWEWPALVCREWREPAQAALFHTIDLLDDDQATAWLASSGRLKYPTRHLTLGDIGGGYSFIESSLALRVVQACPMLSLLGIQDDDDGGHALLSTMQSQGPFFPPVSRPKD